MARAISRFIFHSLYSPTANGSLLERSEMLIEYLSLIYVIYQNFITYNISCHFHQISFPALWQPTSNTFDDFICFTTIDLVIHANQQGKQYYRQTNVPICHGSP